MTSEDVLRKLLSTVTESSTDIMWIKQAVGDNHSQHDKMLEHLDRLNNRVATNAKGVAINKWTNRGIMGVVVIIITILLHIMGVY